VSAQGFHFWRWWLDCRLPDKDYSNISSALIEKRIRYLLKVFAFLALKGGPFVTVYLGQCFCQIGCFGISLERRVLLKREPTFNALLILNSRRLKNSVWFH